MKSKIKFILSMIIFGTIGIFVRRIGLASSEIALLRELLRSLFLFIVIYSLYFDTWICTCRDWIFTIFFRNAAVKRTDYSGIKLCGSDFIINDIFFDSQRKYHCYVAYWWDLAVRSNLYK